MISTKIQENISSNGSNIVLVDVVKHVKTIIHFKSNITLLTCACYIDKRDMYLKIIAAYLHIHWNDVKKIQENISSDGFYNLKLDVVLNLHKIIHVRQNVTLITQAFIHTP